MDSLTAIRNRRSIRSYLDKEIDEAKLHTVVEASDSAPYAGPFHITVVQNKAIMTQLDDLTIAAMKNSVLQFLRDLAEKPGFHPLFNAPAMLVFSAPDANPYGMANCAAAAATGAIAATEVCLGSCFAVTPTLALAEHPDIAQRIGIPEGFKPLCTLIIGYTADPYKDRRPHDPGNNINYFK